MSKLTSTICLLLLAACGPTNRTNNGDDGTDAHAGFDAPDNGFADSAICAQSTVKAKLTPLDLAVMLDQSSSMSDAVAGGSDKWHAVTGALTSFVQQTGLDNVSVGIQYFGLPAAAQTCSVTSCQQTSDCGASACGPCIANVCFGALAGSGDSCAAADYAGAAVEIAPLPGVGSMIISSMSAHSPTTSTPTSAALQGAVDHAKVWATAHPGHAVVVVLATDGDPTECDTDLGHIDAIAAAAKAGTPSIPTFVIGVGSSLASLNGIAAAGGTTMAFLVDTGGNVNQQFLAAMNAIQHSALGCQYTIPVPQSGSPDFGAVNVTYAPGNGGPVQTFPKVANQAACPAGGSGWYYDNDNTPTQIILCSSTCTTVEADTLGEVDIALGCATIIL